MKCKCPACASGLTPAQYLRMACDDHDIRDLVFDRLYEQVSQEHPEVIEEDW